MDYFVDTNIFLRILVKENKKTFEECYRFLQLVETKQIKAITSSLVLAEIDWILEGYYKFKKIGVIKCLKSISKLKGLKIVDNVDISLAIEFYRKYNVKFIDALIASNPKVIKKETIVVSYNKDFDKIGVIRKEPREII